LIATLWIYPHFLAFFNAAAGGPDNGWRALVDSNLDWGQDLGRLADWLAENDIERVWLSYFGEARPEYYGVNYSGLDSFPPRLMNPLARPFYPHDPAPGWYAISATNLQGVHFSNHDQFLYFRDRKPSVKIGYSIFLYKQPASGAPVDLLLSGMQIDQIAPVDFALLTTNEVRPRWFDGERAIIVPGGEHPLWLAVGGRSIHPLLLSYLLFDETMPAAYGEGYALFKADKATPITRPPQSAVNEVMLRLDEGYIAFTGVQIMDNDGMMTVKTTWQQQGNPQPFKLFIHLLDETGAIAAQWDGLDAAWEGWRVGDALIQLHEINLSDLSSGDYRVTTGVYDPESLLRWQSASGADYIELETVTVP
jgi:hypothetical protein